MICAPLLEKNLRTLTGETSIGRHGKKYLAAGYANEQQGG